MVGHKTCICGMGAVTPLGLDALQTAASVRAGLSRTMESSICGRHFEPLVLSLIPDEAFPEMKNPSAAPSGFTSRQNRILRLAAPAMVQALAEAKNLGKIPLLLGCAEPLPGRSPVLNDTFFPALERQTGVALDLANCEIIPNGRAAGLAALELAVIKLEEGFPYVLVGGVDTYLDLYLLATLDAQNRILGGRVMDGFIPGEGAGFILISKKAPYANPPIQIVATAQGFEKGHLYSEEPYRGDGLSETLRSMFQNVPDGPGIQTVFAGLNGEHFGAKEWGVASLRNSARFKEVVQLEHPVDCLGDPGAALGPLMILLAAIGLQRDYVRGPCLVWCSSDYGSRAAAVIDKE